MRDGKWNCHVAWLRRKHIPGGYLTKHTISNTKILFLFLDKFQNDMQFHIVDNLQSGAGLIAYSTAIVRRSAGRIRRPRCRSYDGRP